jgi:hypothetical protein
VFLCLHAVNATGQTSEPLSEARVRVLAQQAQRESKGDPTELVLALDRHVRDTWGEFESFPISIVRREDLLVILSTPYMAYRRSVVDVLRTKRPIDQAVWLSTAVLTISPARLGAPDFETVLLTRDGREVAPAKSALRPMTFADGTGNQSVLHAGDIYFAPSAFAPGARVVLTLRPREGNAIEYAFSDEQLRTLK